MPGKIFVNYRRGDDAGFTQALYMRLEDEFTADALFMDVEGHIKPGDDFVDVLNAQVAAADVLLVVIGPRWSELLAARTGDKDDFVAIEIKAGLDKGKRVIPILVGGASMPRADLMPEPIQALTRRNAVGLRPERFKADCQGLVTALREQLTAAEGERAARTDAERAASEAERKRREAEEAARIAASEERVRAQTVAGLSSDEIRKAEELANWDFIKERGQPQALRDHLARFPAGVTALYALARLEDLVWAGLGSSPGIPALQAFADEFPKGAHAEPAKARVADLQKQAADAREAERLRAQETEAWGAVAASAEPGPITAFLTRWPQGQHAAAARARIEELKRTPGAERRGMLRGAVATVALAILVAGGWWGYEQWRFRESLRDATLKVLERSAQQALKPGETFKECDTCPEMVVIPAGEFTMGSTFLERMKHPHTVTIKGPIAVGKFDVTFDEWDACIDVGVCRHRPDDSGWGRGKRPVIDVSWNDAKEYVKWLAAKTGQSYRLLSEAEWEYAARAGSTTEYPWGDAIGSGNANCRGCGSQWDNKGTAPVGSFKPNAFGLFDMHGNVWQWVEDPYHDNYNRAPSDGSVWTDGGSSSRVLRGGTWHLDRMYVRSAWRSELQPAVRDHGVGFRIARTL
jgi:formylglycine-generating enzyme required for sulfatase activity